jgi:hypothetical protein
VAVPPEVHIECLIAVPGIQPPQEPRQPVVNLDVIFRIFDPVLERLDSGFVGGAVIPDVATGTSKRRRSAPSCREYKYVHSE